MKKVEAEREQGRKVSRRRLLKLAAYSVPAMQMLNVAASSRALAMTPLPGCEFPLRVKWVDPNRPGYKAVCCPGGSEHNDFQPTHCDKFVSTGEAGKGFVFVRCDKDQLWEPTPEVCYTFTPCPDPQTPECYQAWRNCELPR